VRVRVRRVSSVGFTGTQRGLSTAQAAALRTMLAGWPVGYFHHGDCIGADAEAHAIARELGWKIVLHPPTIDTKRAHLEADCAIVCKTRPYLERNQRIVESTAVMIATPGEFEEQLRSGTWATVRLARKANRPLALVYPDGYIATERWQLQGSVVGE
jgi:hypothetical protein